MLNKKRSTHFFLLLFCLILLTHPLSFHSLGDTQFPNNNVIVHSFNSLIKSSNDSVDQFQPLWSGGIAAGTPDILAQSFKPTKNLLTRVELLIHKTEETSNNVTVSIRNTLDGSDLTRITINATNISLTRSWVEFDFPDIHVEVNQTYYILFQTDGTEMIFVWWGYDNHNIDSYPRGKAWLYTGGAWTTEGFVIKDWSFKTYGYHSSQPPNQPIIVDGPTEGLSWHEYTFVVTASDPDGDSIRFGWDLEGDGIINEWSSYYPSGDIVGFSTFWKSSGQYDIQVKAEDRYGIQSSFSDIYTINISNDPPLVPSMPSGVLIGMTSQVYYFETVTTDPEGDMIQYGWDWDSDTVVDEWTNFSASGKENNNSHSWYLAGTYYIRVKARDNKSAESIFSDGLKVIIIDTDNTPPEQPTMPVGPTLCRKGISYSYGSVAFDQNGDNIYYKFDWDDGSNSSWIGPFSSGQPCNVSHTWHTTGSFQIKVKARDVSLEESIWSDPLSITLPKNHQLSWNIHCLNFLREKNTVLWELISNILLGNIWL